MPLTAHLRELRRRVAWSLVAVAVASAAAFWWYEHGLGELIRAPYCSLPPDLRYTDASGGCGLLVTDVFGGALVRLKVSLVAGVVLSGPVWLGQLWGFLAPGLRRHERRWTAGFVLAASTLLAAGTTLAYLVLETGLRFLLTLAGADVVVALTAQDYLRYVTTLLLAFSMALQLPLLAVCLNLVGALSHRAMAGARHWIFFLSLVFAALATPPDPMTMVVLALPMCVLFEGAIQFARIVDRRRARRAAAAPLDEPSEPARP
ncbi:twin-arginine translocase subunit TatC [Blastococcus sp. KM273128]|uniref:twin-arginine translocase subunit TatC n=1 Tax=Blastococcus sp. KM273128 TaxID=2570314 RepID=UPI001EFFF9A3|nr:twin-arginine translocase subunit TatC [Blastococcus sp. KM273128]MCF6744615.1 twin-arginine translocase subunit TatC [Blastococcus sp. KM273128]